MGLFTGNSFSAQAIGEKNFSAIPKQAGIYD